jgi:hypothetical protein
MTSARPSWSIRPGDIRRSLKLATSRCYAIIREARKVGNQSAIEAFTTVLNKIKEADLAVREARISLGWDSSAEEDAPHRNPCCGNVGTRGEGEREYCSTCGQEVL